MIESADEFKRLRESDIPQEYGRASSEGAETEIWFDVLDKYADMAFWVAQNKTVPVEVLEVLAKHHDPKVRGMVARKRKLPESVMVVLAKDPDESVRYAVGNNSKVTQSVLKILIDDPRRVVRECVLEKLNAPTNCHVSRTLV